MLAAVKDGWVCLWGDGLPKFPAGDSSTKQLCLQVACSKAVVAAASPRQHVSVNPPQRRNHRRFKLYTMSYCEYARYLLAFARVVRRLVYRRRRWSIGRSLKSQRLQLGRQGCVGLLVCAK